MDSNSDNKHEGKLDFLPKDQADKLMEMFGPEFFTPRMIEDFKKFNLAESALQRHQADDCGAAPLMQVISITLHKYSDDVTPSEIYGEIVIDDGEGPSISIYNCSVNNPQRVDNGGRLMLSIPNDSRPIIPSNMVDIHVSLLSRKIDGDDDDVVQGSNRCDFTKFTQYDVPCEVKIQGALDFVRMEYIVFRHSMSITLDAKLLKKQHDDGGVNSAHLYGTISVCCGDKFVTNLFEKEESESVTVHYGSHIGLNRALVVIPVWTDFVIQAELRSRNPHKEIAVGKIDDLCADDIGLEIEKIEGKDGILEVQVTWNSVFTQIPTGNDTHDLSPVVKRMKVARDEQPLVAANISRNLVSDLRTLLEQTEDLQFELFSLSVHNSSHKKEFSVWGSVVAVDIRTPVRFWFKKDKANAIRLGHNQTLPLESLLLCMKFCQFNFLVDLKDEDDCVISYGRFYWVPLNPRISYGRKLASVVIGDDGYYTALHCSAFEGGIQATVKVYVINKGSAVKKSGARVYGCVRSQYSTFKYFTIDDNELYTRKLYERSAEDGFVLEFSESQTPPPLLLSESIVSVPIRCALCVDVDLKVIHTDGSDGGVHVGQAVFSTEDKIESWSSLETLGCQIQVSVEWEESAEMPE